MTRRSSCVIRLKRPNLDAQTKYVGNFLRFQLNVMFAPERGYRRREHFFGSHAQEFNNDGQSSYFRRTASHRSAIAVLFQRQLLWPIAIPHDNSKRREETHERTGTNCSGHLQSARFRLRGESRSGRAAGGRTFIGKLNYAAEPSQLERRFGNGGNRSKSLSPRSGS